MQAQLGKSRELKSYDVLEALFREVMPWRNGVLACLWAPCFRGCSHSNRLRTALQTRRVSSEVTSNVVNNVAVQSNGLPVPFATVFNTNTGQAAVANAEGVAAVPVGVNDTLRIQSMGYER